MNSVPCIDEIVSALEEGARLRVKIARQLAPIIASAAGALTECLDHGGQILLCGNGGSAADAQHIAAEFVGRFVRERRALPALALTTDSSILTAIGNDYGFEEVFARQIQALGRPGDVLIATSTSGNSPNVLAAVKAAKSKGMKTIGLAGRDGGVLGGVVDIPLVVRSLNTARVQECHIAIGHILCELVDERLFRGANDNGHKSEPRGGGCSGSRKVLNWETLLARRAGWAAAKESVVWTNGCFDLVHVGHIRSLTEAKKLGDVLVVGLNSDSSVRDLKGPSRPIIPELERAELLAALSCVDAVIIFDESTPEVSLTRLKPDIHCKGADYAPPHGKPIPEAKVVEAYGGQVRFLPLIPDTSTSRIIEKIAANGPPQDLRNQPSAACSAVV
jgi:phosphoheptose isomerase